MRYESSVTSLSWIPSEAVTGGTRAAFDAGVTRYDEPPPDELGDVETLRAEDRFRFANVIRVERDGEPLTEYGPGALLGERAALEGGTRTSTLEAVTPCVVAAVDAGQLERSAMEELSGSHRREETTPAEPQ